MSKNPAVYHYVKILRDAVTNPTKAYFFNSWIECSTPKECRQYAISKLKTKFNYSQLFSLAREGITSFSIFPLRISQFLGLIGIIISLILGVYVIFDAIIGNAPDGIPIIILLILLFGSLNLFSLGIIGEYVGKNYIESKNRPVYIIDEKIINEE